ncbi:MAG: hypothetical protein LBT94_05820 [Prevotellaceae bacterium]|jgi:hypothetical protein|nr:hypothetical protein [Prevotellaceae bacterium]
MLERPVLIAEALRQYHSYNSDEWEKVYFDEASGGFNVYHKAHQFTPKGGGDKAEKVVGKMLAKHGKRVEFLPENGKGKSVPDLAFDGKTWDVKYINHANEETIRTYIKDTRKAENALFYWDENDKLDALKSAVVRSIGYFKKKNTLRAMPNIYYINKEGALKPIFVR